MDRTQFRTPPRWWPPKLSPTWVKLLRPLRRRMRVHGQRLREVDFRGIEHLEAAVAADQGVLITPNHSGHADAYLLYEAADRLGTPFYFMTAWQVLGLVPRIRRWILRKHGCFSVHREGTDLQAFREATDILQNRQHPLVIFPEGEVYHLNERVTPFREGPAAMALTAARRGDRPVVCVPCAIRYYYTQDPTPELLEVMARLERAMFWRVRDDMPLEKRIYRLAEGILGLKELEYLGQMEQGTLRERIAGLSHAILGRLEEKHGIRAPVVTIPERVKALRQKVIQCREELDESDPRIAECEIDMEDLHLVVQSFSYPGDYVFEKPTIERLAETIDKFEEDILGARTATIRGARRATVSFGEPVEVPAEKRKDAAAALSQTLEQRVQELLDTTSRPPGCCDDSITVAPPASTTEANA